MFENILQQFRNHVYNNNYIITFHAFEEMEDDELNVYDVESCILSGKVIEKQKDTLTNENKYRLRGFSVREEIIEIVAKKSITGKLVIITIFKIL